MHYNAASIRKEKLRNVDVELSVPRKYHKEGLLDVQTDCYLEMKIFGADYNALFCIVVESKDRKSFDEQLGRELLSFNTKSDMIFHEKSTELREWSHPSYFIGIKYIFATCEFPPNFLKWCLACGIFVINPSVCVPNSVTSDTETLRFLISIANFNRLSGRSNPFTLFRYSSAGEYLEKVSCFLKTLTLTELPLCSKHLSESEDIFDETVRMVSANAPKRRKR